MIIRAHKVDQVEDRTNKVDRNKGSCRMLIINEDNKAVIIPLGVIALVSRSALERFRKPAARAGFPTTG